MRGDVTEAKEVYDKASNAFSGLADDPHLIAWISIPNEEMAGQAQGKIIGALVDHPEVARRYHQLLAIWMKRLPDGLQALRDYRNGQAEVYWHAGEILQQLLANLADAEQACRRALALREAILVDFPSAYECRLKLIQGYCGLAKMLEATRLPVHWPVPRGRESLPDGPRAGGAGRGGTSL